MQKTRTTLSNLGKMTNIGSYNFEISWKGESHPCFERAFLACHCNVNTENLPSLTKHIEYIGRWNHLGCKKQCNVLKGSSTSTWFFTVNYRIKFCISYLRMNLQKIFFVFKNITKGYFLRHQKWLFKKLRFVRFSKTASILYDFKSRRFFPNGIDFLNKVNVHLLTTFVWNFCSLFWIL